MITILATIFVLGLLIFIHEFGHFIFAKLTGMRVERFSLGYPPRLFGKKIGETDYCISATPLGGYCKIAGMVDESMDKDGGIKGEPWEFQSKPVYARFLVIFAGPFMNFLLAVLIFSVIVFVKGTGKPNPEPVIGQVIEGLPAAEAGIAAGDRIVEIEGIEINNWSDVTNIIHSRPNEPVDLKIERGDEIIDLKVTPSAETSPETGEKIGMIGITSEIIYEKAGLFGSINQGAAQAYNLTKLILGALKKVITGEESIKSFGGPIIIAKFAGESARAGAEPLFFFIAFLSINLALLNLLPVPALDGGHIIFLAVEGITRKKISTKVKLVFQQIGMILLLIFIVFIIYNDVLRVLK